MLTVADSESPDCHSKVGTDPFFKKTLLRLLKLRLFLVGDYELGRVLVIFKLRHNGGIFRKKYVLC